MSRQLPGSVAGSIWVSFHEPERLAEAIEDGTALICALGHGAEMVVGGAAGSEEELEILEVGRNQCSAAMRSS